MIVMPHIVFRNLKKDVFEKIAFELGESIYKIANCPIDKVTFNLLDSYTIIKEKDSNKFCYVDISYIERDSDVQEKIAQTIDDTLRANGKDNIAINFNFFNKLAYYDNMKLKI